EPGAAVLEHEDVPPGQPAPLAVPVVLAALHGEDPTRTGVRTSRFPQVSAGLLPHFPVAAPASGITVGQRAVHPPSMSTVSPVMSDAAGEARNTTTPATSTGSPTRCRAAIRSTTSAWNAGSASAGSVPGVRMNVGATALT